MATTPTNNQFQIPTGYTEHVPEAIVERVSSPEFIHYPNQELLNIEMDIFEARTLEKFPHGYG